VSAFWFSFFSLPPYSFMLPLFPYSSPSSSTGLPHQNKPETPTSQGPQYNLRRATKQTVPAAGGPLQLSQSFTRSFFSSTLPTAFSKFGVPFWRVTRPQPCCFNACRERLIFSRFFLSALACPTTPSKLFRLSPGTDYTEDNDPGSHPIPPTTLAEGLARVEVLPSASWSPSSRPATNKN